MIDPRVVPGPQTRHVHHPRKVISQRGTRPVPTRRVKQLELDLSGIGAECLVISRIGRIRLHHGHPHGVHGGTPVAIRVGVQDRVEPLSHRTGVEPSHGIRDASPAPRSARWIGCWEDFLKGLVAIRRIGRDQLQLRQFKNVGHPGVASGAAECVGGEHRDRENAGDRLELEGHRAIAAGPCLPLEIGSIRLAGREDHEVADTRRARTIDFRVRRIRHENVQRGRIAATEHVGAHDIEGHIELGHHVDDRRLKVITHDGPAIKPTVVLRSGDLHLDGVSLAHLRRRQKVQGRQGEHLHLFHIRIHPADILDVHLHLVEARILENMIERRGRGAHEITIDRPPEIKQTADALEQLIPLELHPIAFADVAGMTKVDHGRLGGRDGPRMGRRDAIVASRSRQSDLQRHGVDAIIQKSDPISGGLPIGVGS